MTGETPSATYNRNSTAYRLRGVLQRIFSPRTRSGEWAWTLSWSGLFSAVLMMPYLAAGSYLVWFWDGGIFAYVAQQWMQGLSLYTEVWDIKLPFIFIMNAIGLWMGGGKAWGIALWAGICATGFAALFLWALRPYCSRAARLTGLAAVFLWLGKTAKMNSVGGFSLIPHMLILAILLWETDSGKWGRYAFLGGAASAILFFARPNQMFSGLVYLVCILLWAQHRWFAAVKCALGALVPTVLILMLVYRTGSIREMWGSVMGESLRYAQFQPPIRRLLFFPFAFEELGETALLSLALTISFWGLLRIGRTPLPAVVRTGVLLFFVEIAGAATSGLMFPIYLFPVLPACGLLAAWFVDQIGSGSAFQNVNPAGSSIWHLDIRTCFCAAAILIFGFHAVRLFAETRHKPTPVLNLARRIDAATPRTARVYVWASNGNSLPFHLNRPPASRFFMPMHAVAPLLSASFMPELVADLERAQPAIVAECWQNDFSQLMPQTRAYLFPPPTGVPSDRITPGIRERLDHFAAGYTHLFTDDAAGCVVYAHK